MSDITIVLRGDAAGLTGTLTTSAGASRRLREEFDGLGNTARRRSRDVDAIGEAAQRSGARAQGLVRSLTSVRGTIASLGIGFAANEILQAGLSLDRWERGLAASRGSTRAAAQEVDFLRTQAERLGIALPSIAQGWVSISNAAKGTALEGQHAREAFLGVIEAGRAFNLTGAQIDGTLQAVQQIISKGVVSLEELRAQLGDRLPGAMQIAARSMNMTTGELIDLISKGKLAAQDFLPAFAKGLRESAAAGVELARNSPTAEIERLKTALFEMAAELAEGGVLEETANMVRELTSSLKDLVSSGAAREVGEDLGILIRNLDRLLVLVTAFAAARGVGALSAGFRRLATDIALTATPIEAFVGGGARAATVMGTMGAAGARLFAMIGGWPTIIAAAVAGLYTMADAIQETERRAQQAADDARREREELNRSIIQQRQQARQDDPSLILADIERTQARIDQLSPRSRSGAFAGAYAAQLAAAREQLTQLEAEYRRANGSADQFDQTVTGQRKSIDELTEDLRKQNLQLQTQAIRMKDGEAGVARFLAKQLDWSNATREQRQAMTEQLRLLGVNEAALDQLKETTKQTAKETKENARAHEEYSRVLQQLLDEVDPLNGVMAEQAELEKSLKEWADAGAISQEEYARAIRLATQATAQRVEALDKTEEKEKDLLEARNRAAADYEDYLNDLREEAELLKVSGRDREDLAIQFEAMAASSRAAAEGVKSSADAVAELLTRIRDLREEDAAAQELEQLWTGVGDRIRGALVSAFQQAGEGMGEVMRAAAEDIASDLVDYFAHANIQVPLQQVMQNGGSMTPQQADQMALGVGQMVGSYGGAVVGGGGSGAQIGSAIGAALGSYFGPIGAIVGGLLGGWIGGMFDDPPKVSVSSGNRPGAEGHAYSAFGAISVSTQSIDSPTSPQIAAQIAQLDNAIAQMLSPAEIQAVTTAMQGFHAASGDLDKVLRQRLNVVIRTVAPQFEAFLSKFQDIGEAVKQLEALRSLQKFVDDFALTIDNLVAGPGQQIRAQLDGLGEAMETAVANMQFVATSGDAVRVAEAAAAAQGAIIQKFETERRLVLDLQQAIVDLGERVRQFRSNIAQRILQLGGDAGDVSGQIRGDLPGLQESVLNAADTQTALANLDRFVSAVDTWLNTARAEIEAWAAQARQRIQRELDELAGRESEIMAAGQLRYDAAVQAANAAQQAAQAALQAERERLQRELAVAQAFGQVLAQAKQLLQQLEITTASPLPGFARADILESQISELRARMLSATGEERARLQSELLGLLQQRIGLAQELFQRPSPEYLEVFNATVAEISQLRDEAQTEADRALDLQEQLNALAEQTNAGISNLTDVTMYLSGEERAELAAIAARRAELEAEAREIDRQAQERLDAVNAEAVTYYQWAQHEFESLQAARHEELVAILNDVTGGLDPDSFLAQRAAETVGLLTQIRDQVAAFLRAAAGAAGFNLPGSAGNGGSSGPGGSIGPGVIPPIGGVGPPVVVPGPGRFPASGLEAGSLNLSVVVNANTAGGVRPQDIGEAVAVAMRRELPALAKKLPYARAT